MWMAPLTERGCISWGCCVGVCESDEREGEGVNGYDDASTNEYSNGFFSV